MPDFENYVSGLNKRETQQLLEMCLVNLDDDDVIESLERHFDADTRADIAEKWVECKPNVVTGEDEDTPEME